MQSGPRLVALLGILAGLAALLQLGPVYWPGVGYLLAMAATLPAAVAAALAPRRCTWFYFAAALIIGLAAVEEMMVFLLLTGPPGLMLGWLRRRPAWQATGAAAVVLTAGLLALPALAGVFPWGGVEQGWPLPVTAAAYAGFAVVYAALWRGFFSRIWSRLAGALFMRYTEEDDAERSYRL